MKCTKCGKEIMDGAAFCQHCGARQTKANPLQDMNRGNKVPNNTMCVIGLVIAVLTFFFSFGPLGGVIAVGLSVYGLMDCKKKGEGGRGFAIAGILFALFNLMGM